jgi:hypothetical protein
LRGPLTRGFLKENAYDLRSAHGERSVRFGITHANLFFSQWVPDATESDRLEIFAIGCGKFFNTKVPKSKAQSQIDDPAKRK